MKITRRGVLSEALRYRETVMKQASVNGMGLRARAGMQETFDRYQEECRILRELMQALEYEPVRAAIAEFLAEGQPEVREWQKQVIQGNKHISLFTENCICCEYLRYLFNEEGEYAGHYCSKKPVLKGDYEICVTRRMKGCPIYGYQEENGADHPEGRDVSGGTDTVQPGPEMERQPVGRMADEDPGGGQERAGQNRRRDLPV